MLHRKLAISLLDFVVARILRDAHNLVVIPFRHIGSAPPRPIKLIKPGGSLLDAWSLATHVVCRRLAFMLDSRDQ
jgi:hypothetical protein